MGIKPQILARFVWSTDGLWPGPVDRDDERLRSHLLHVEMRRTKREPLPLNEIQSMTMSGVQMQIDARITTHKEVVDLLMVGAERACIDLFSNDSEIKDCHELTEHVAISIRLPDEFSLTYMTDKLNPRLREVTAFGPELVVVSSSRAGDIGFFFDKIPEDIRRSYLWMLAPYEGSEIPLRRSDGLAGWVLDGERMIGV